MDELRSPEFLRNNQYQDSRKLSARLALHQQFSSNPEDWFRWVFSRLDVQPQSRFLEIGSGPGTLWQKNQSQLPPDYRVTLGDISPGMLLEARGSLGESPGFDFVELNAAQLPFPESHFRGVVANHMLYHVGSLSKTLSEIHRVLQPGGRLYAATNGDLHLSEIRQWQDRFWPSPDSPSWGTLVGNFNLENGAELLQHWFPEIHLEEYPDQLMITEIQPVVDYIISYLDHELEPELLAALIDHLQGELDAQGAIRVTKQTGLFTALKS